MWNRLAAALTVVAVSASLRAEDASQQPVFRAGVDLVVVEVQVVDASGAPVTGLEPSHFSVRINGRRRTVMSSELLQYGSGAAPVPRRASGGPTARNLWPAAPDAPARTFVLAVDAGSFTMGDGAAVARSVTGFVDQLSSADPVGVVALPRGVVLRPTLDRHSVRQSIGTLTGQAGLRANPRHLSVTEVVDIAAELERDATVTMAGRGGRGQVMTTQQVLRQVQARECSGAMDQGCLEEIAMEAEAQARDMEDRVAESLDGLKRLLRLLADYPGRKTVVLMSAGMPASDRAGGWHRDGSEARALGQAAALASATVYAVHIDTGYRSVTSAEVRSPRAAVSLGRERDLQQRLLADFAEASGGVLIGAPTDAGERALARVLRETSAYYALGIVAEPRDLDGRAHPLRVDVSYPGAVVRSGRYVVPRAAR